MTALRDFTACRSGMAALEFAIILPMMLILFCGAVEITNLYTADRKVVQAAQSCADLIAQEKSINSTKLADIARAVELVLEPYPSTGLAFRISSVEFDPLTGAPRLGWQQIIGGFSGAGRPAPTQSAANLGLPGESVIIVDLSYNYTPLFSSILPDRFAINELAAARPRRVRVIPCNATGC